MNGETMVSLLVMTGYTLLFPVIGTRLIRRYSE